MRSIIVNALLLANKCFSAPPSKTAGTPVDNIFGIKSEQDSYLTFFAVDGNFTKQQQTTVPYQTKAPYMVFNSEISQIEVFGDWRTAPRAPHQKSLHHYFYDYTSNVWTDNTLESLYEGENQGVAVYTDEIGTVLMSGWSWTYSDFAQNCYQVTLPKSFNDKIIEIPDLPVAMDNFGGKYYNSKIYVSGGYYQENSGSFVTEFYPTALYSLNLANVNSPSSMIPDWEFLKPLSKPGMPLEMEIFDGILYTFNGISDLKVYNVGVETYDLQTGETQYIDNVLNFGRYHGAFVLTNSDQGVDIKGDPMLTMIGGELYPDCNTDTSVSCNTAEQGVVAFKNVAKFALVQNADFTQYDNNYLASVKFFG